MLWQVLGQTTKLKGHPLFFPFFFPSPLFVCPKYLSQLFRLKCSPWPGLTPPWTLLHSEFQTRPQAKD